VAYFGYQFQVSVVKVSLKEVWNETAGIEPESKRKMSRRNVISVDHIASADFGFVVSWLVLPFREKKNSTGLVKYKTVLYLQINTRNCILLKISALVLLLKYS